MAESSPPVLRVHLEQERDRLRDKLRELGLGPDGSLSFDGGFADSSQVTAERGEIEALASTFADALREIEEALAKMDDDTYGRCELCHAEIGEARLEAMPAARLCIACASKSR